jgi:hypothetical protein
MTYLVGSVERVEIFKRTAVPEMCILLNRYDGAQEARRLVHVTLLTLVQVVQLASWLTRTSHQS